MSQDFQLAWPCPHFIGEEKVGLRADRRTLAPLKPVAGTGLCSVRANGLEIPPAVGVRVPASLESSVREPYHITRSSRELAWRTRLGSRTVQLTLGYRTASEIASETAQAGLLEVAAAGGSLVWSDGADRGPDSYLEITGTARAPLGLGEGWGARGRQVFPRWGVAARAEPGPGAEGGYDIQFETPVPGNPVFTVSYTVAPNQCLRCRATGVENDFRPDSRGAPHMVSGADLLYQSCVKILLTELRSNIYYPWYGSSITATVGTKALPGTAAALRASVYKALSNLQGLQSAQSKYQFVSAEERLHSVDRVEVSQNTLDPTVFLIEVTVRSFSSRPISLTVVYTSPGTFALAGSNGLAMGVRG